MKIINRKKIENTPFDICQMEENKKYYITIGNAIVSDGFQNEEDAMALINAKDWNLLFNTICYVNHVTAQRKEDENA